MKNYLSSDHDHQQQRQHPYWKKQTTKSYRSCDFPTFYLTKLSGQVAGDVTKQLLCPAAVTRDKTASREHTEGGRALGYIGRKTHWDTHIPWAAWPKGSSPSPYAEALVLAQHCQRPQAIFKTQMLQVYLVGYKVLDIIINITLLF